MKNQKRIFFDRGCLHRSLEQPPLRPAWPRSFASWSRRTTASLSSSYGGREAERRKESEKAPMDDQRVVCEQRKVGRRETVGGRQRIRAGCGGEGEETVQASEGVVNAGEQEGSSGD